MAQFVYNILLEYYMNRTSTEGTCKNNNDLQRALLHFLAVFLLTIKWWY